MPPEDNTGRGIGHLRYFVEPKLALPTGTQIHNVAIITFDANPAISTDQIDPLDPSKGLDPNKRALNTIDAGAPGSSMIALPATIAPSTTIYWSGGDDPSGSGIATYDIYVSDNGGAFTPLLLGTTNTSTTFNGQVGHTYGFYSVATDHVGNHEAAPITAQTSATVAADQTPPTSHMDTLATFSPASFVVGWSGNDNAGGSGIASFDIFVSDNGDSFVPFLTGTTQTSATFTGQDGHTYDFYSVATDAAGNVEFAIPISQATTTVDAGLPTSTVAALPTYSITLVNLNWSGSDNSGGSGIVQYKVFVSDNGGAYTQLPTTGTQSSYPFLGQDGHSYSFYSIAIDGAGNVQPTPVAPQATTLVDTVAPTSTVAALPSVSDTSFTLSWSGSDTTGGSGIASFDIFVSEDGGAFAHFLTGTTLTSSTFTGIPGHSYGFYSVAQDLAGNRQPTPASAQASTSVVSSQDTTAPTSTVLPLSIYSPATFTVTWTGSDNAGGTGIAKYEVFVSDNGGAFTKLTTSPLQTSASFTGQDGHTYGFYSVATDAAGNRQATPASAQTTTTVDATAPTSSVSSLAGVHTTNFTVSWSGSDGGFGSGIAFYDVFVNEDGGAFVPFATGTTLTSKAFTGMVGHSFGFYSVATDNVGNRQPTPASAQTTANVTSGPDTTRPTSTVLPLAAYSTANFAVTWSGSDNVGGSGIASYTIFVSDNGDSFVPFLTGTTLTSATFSGQDGHTYGFYSVAKDAAGNVEFAIPIAQATTTVDAGVPTSTVAALPTYSTSFVNLNWTGTDNAGGSDIVQYKVFVSDNGGAYTQIPTTGLQSSYPFQGQDGHSYRFYSIAIDAAGNTQATPATPQATTLVDTVEPTSTVAALPAISGPSINLSWSGSDTAGGSGIATYDIYASEDAGPFVKFLTDTTLTSTVFTGAPGHTFGFYSVARDLAGNQESKPASAEATTTVASTNDTTAPTSTVLPLSNFSPASFTVIWSGSDNVGGTGIAKYELFVSDNGGAFTKVTTTALQTSVSFTGQEGHTYGFYTVATDNSGNVQATPSSAQTTTTIDATAPTSKVAVLSPFSKLSFTVTWAGTDNTGGSGIANYDVFVSDNGGAFTKWQSATTQTTAIYVGVAPHSYSFYSVALDKAGNRQTVPTTAQATTQCILDTPSKQYVASVYVNLLQRSVDGQGLTYWSGRLDNGGARSIIAAELTHSAEYYATNVIQPAYKQFLNRKADQGGLDFWTSKLQNGETDEQMQAGFIASDEFYRIANKSATNVPVTPAHDRTWVDALYVALLGRGPDQVGEDFWTGQLQGIQTREQVAGDFTGSTEGLSVRIQQTYQRYLGRGADDGGLAYWLSQYQKGSVNEDIVTGFIGSDEFFNQATK